MPVAVMVAPAVGGMERVGGGHIIPVAEMRAPAVGRTGGCKAEGQFGPTDQHQRTLQKSRLYLVIAAVTVGGKVDTAETGVGGDFELSTEAPLDKIDPPFLDVVVRRKLK